MNINAKITSRRVPRFVEQFCKHGVGTTAAIEAGWPDSWASVAAHQLLSEPKIQELIAEHKAKVANEAMLEAKDVLKLWFDVATADPSKLTHTRRVNCRHCWGVGHAWQWGDRQYVEESERCIVGDLLSKREDGQPEPRADFKHLEGGPGWRKTREPNPECPECDGEGVEDVWFADVRTLTGPERRLFAGVKRTKDGLEIKMHDQQAAALNIAKYLGMQIERKEVTGKDGAPLMPTSITVCGPDE